MNFFIRLFLLLVFTSATAQQIDATKINWKKRTDNAKIALFADGDERNLYVLAYKPGNLKVLRYNSALFLRDSVSYNVNESLQKNIQMTFKTDSVFIHFIDEAESRLITLKTNQNFDSYAMHSQAIFETGEVCTAQFQDGNQRHFLTVNKNTKACFAYSLQGTSVIKKAIDTTPFDNFNGNELFADFLRKQDFAEINDNYTPVLETLNADKCFFKNGKAIFLRARKGSTTMQEIDFRSYTTKSSVFNSNVHNPDNYTSSLGKKELFEISTSKDSLVVVVTDLQSKKILKRWQVGAKTDARSSDFQFYEQRNGGVPRSELQTKRFLKRISQPKMGLSVYESENGKLITIGSLDGGVSAGGFLLYAVAAVADYDPDDDLYENSILFYAELATDAFLQPKKYLRCVPAIDEILQFNDEKKIEVNAITKFKNAYIQAAFVPEDQTLNVSKFLDRD
ncbi:hypothetical protein [Flavobacterium aurantiibacter]|uniref:Uncharacterized protein n=1 Tax=Flavobacterium aurantiibacter TaxID=2023067 RepID=A0A255ZQG8_9FLAO|nr:hypothetical protein [Flavobacterium aurantiibacter]OYQ43659.1 hypothetical protein CHX27_09295 [Flavobacterium aurantiibacter]